MVQVQIFGDLETRYTFFSWCNIILGDTTKKWGFYQNKGHPCQHNEFYSRRRILYRPAWNSLTFLPPISNWKIFPLLLSKYLSSIKIFLCGRGNNPCAFFVYPHLKEVRIPKMNNIEVFLEEEEAVRICTREHFTQVWHCVIISEQVLRWFEFRKLYEWNGMRCMLIFICSTQETKRNKMTHIRTLVLLHAERWR